MKYLKYKFKYLTEKTKIYGGSERCLTGEFNFCNNIPSIFKTDICLDQEGIITDHMPLISCINILDSYFNIFTLNFGDATYTDNYINEIKQYNEHRIVIKNNLKQLIKKNNNRLNKLKEFINKFDIICLQEISEENTWDIYDTFKEIYFINYLKQERNNTYIITLIKNTDNIIFYRYIDKNDYLLTIYKFNNIYIYIINCKFPVLSSEDKKKYVENILKQIHINIRNIIKDDNMIVYFILTGDFNIHKTTDSKNIENITFIQYLLHLCYINKYCMDTYRINNNDYMLIYHFDKYNKYLFYEWDDKIDGKFKLDRKGYTNKKIDNN
jgi:hypothetical protein